MFLMSNEQRLVASARYESIKEICDFAVQAAAGAGLNSRAAFHVQLAVDEACTNIVEHAYGGNSEGVIQITCKVQGDEFVVELEDQGASFDPAKVPTPTIESGRDKPKIGGLGIHFMRKMMDRIEYHFSPGRNRVRMVKQIRRESK